MQIGMIGLGRMGGSMSVRLSSGGHQVVGYDVNRSSAERPTGQGVELAHSLEDLAGKLDTPRIVWMMVPAGDPVRGTVHTLLPYLTSGDLVIDGGNSNFHDSVSQAAILAERGVQFLDVGVSGGVWGREEGYCLMVGGNRDSYTRVEPILSCLAENGGYAYVGQTGAGHYAKMVHNGIEYAMLEAYGEGFELLKGSQYHYDLHQLAELWMHGGVVRSWLLELAERAFNEDPDLSKIRGYVEDSGEGRWTVEEAIHDGIPVPGIANALFARFRSRQEESFAAKVIAALRHQFGGHRVMLEAGQPDADQKST